MEEMGGGWAGANYYENEYGEDIGGWAGANYYANEYGFDMDDMVYAWMLDDFGM